MLRINRLRVEINTVNGVYGIDETFQSGLNFIASLETLVAKVLFSLLFITALDLSRFLAEQAALEAKFLHLLLKQPLRIVGSPGR